MTKAEVRARAAALGLRTAAKPDSQDVCFITSTGGRESFLGIASRSVGPRCATGGETVGEVHAVELVTLGQRRGLQLAGAPERRYVVDIDHDAGGGDGRRRARPATSTRCSSGASRGPNRPVTWSGARAVQRPRGGGARRCSTPTVVVRWEQPATAGRPGSERRVLRPVRHDVLGGGIAGVSGPISPVVPNPGMPRRRASRSTGTRERRAHEERPHVERPSLGLFPGRGEHDLVAGARQPDLDGRARGRCPVRSAASVSAGASTQPATVVGANIDVSASTSWSWTTTPAGTKTSQRRESRWNRRATTHVHATRRTP